MATNLSPNNAKRRLFAELRTAIEQRNLDQLKLFLVEAGANISDDTELEGFQHQLVLLEHAASVATTLFVHGRRRIQCGDYEAGLKKLQQARQMDPTNRAVQELLFDTLTDFAKITVDIDPDRARHLLQEASEIRPLDLHLAAARNFVADRIRQNSAAECLTDALFDNPEVSHPPPDDTGEVPINSLWRSISVWVGNLQLQQLSSSAAETTVATLQQLRVRVEDRWTSVRGRITRSQIAYSAAAVAACLVVVFATAQTGKSTGRRPELLRIGTGTLLHNVTLVRGPAEESRVAGALKSGQQVELLRRIPETTLDAWTQIRAVDNPEISGYVRLQNLEQVRTGDRPFDLWVAASLLDRSISSSEFRSRLEYVEQSLKTDPLPPSRDADLIFLKLAKSYARLASERSSNPAELESTRLELANSEAYLKKIEGALQFSDDADTLQHSIPRMRAALERSVAPKAPPATKARRVSEETRILRLAKSSYSKGRYDSAIQYCTQILKINSRNAEARKLLATVRRAQKDLKSKMAQK